MSWEAWDNSAFDDLFNVNDNDEGQTVVELLVTIQAIGTSEEADFDIESDAKWRSYMFSNEVNMEPFCAWVEVDSDIDKKLLSYGEKAAHITGKFRFFSDSVYGNNYECTIDSIEDTTVDAKSYRVFGKVTNVSDDGKLSMDMYTVDASTCTPITYPMTFAFSDSYEPAEYADLEADDYVNLLLYRSKSDEEAGKDPVILAVITVFDASEVATPEEGSAESEFFNEIKFTSLKQSPLYSVFSNGLTAVTGVYNLADDDYVMDHASPYYTEGENADGEGDGEYTLISTIDYDQGVLCDIPGQNDDEDEEIALDKSISAWVYQDASIQDVENREYYMPVINNIEQIEKDSGQRNFIDPLYHSYLAVGMSDNHYLTCDLPLHYTGNGDGTHTVMCDDYIIHDQAEQCVDEHGDLCKESGKPCVNCGCWCFPDVSDPKAWYYKAVYKSVDLGLFKGYSSGLFGPNDTLTRAQVAVVLWRYLDPTEADAYVKEKAKNETGMTDVADAAFYTGAANWAVANGVITGKNGGTQFDPNGQVTAEQFCSILFKTAKAEKPSGTEKIDSLADKASISSWATSACEWAMEKDVLHGYNADGVRTLRPQEAVTRARAATLLVNAIDNGVLVKEDFE